MPTHHLQTLRRGPSAGSNSILDRREDPETGLDFRILKILAGETATVCDPQAECAVLVVEGSGTLSAGGSTLRFSRASFVEESPWAAHVPRGDTIEIKADTDAEVAVVAADNPASFPARLFEPSVVENEHRGKGLLADAAYRIVRCVFDRRSAPPESRLVLGEVVTLPGRWSSYPPHHHPQPEIYYYRFSPPQGYGHGEVGEEVFMLRDHDLLRIPAGKDHAQVAAPGYHMYYLWAIRHLPGNPYEGFEYHPEHGKLLGGGR